MTVKDNYHGVVIPMVTAINSDQRLDQPSVKRLTDFVVGSGTIPFILGTTGESASLPTTMCNEMVQLVVGRVKEKTKIYAGISDTCFANSVEKATKYFDLGVDVFVAHIPEYYPLTPDQILRYFEQLAETVPAPLILYNIPATTKVSIPVEVVEKLSKHPNIVALKDSERSLERMQILADTFASRPDFSIMSGWTVESMNALQMGFDGIVPSTGNLIPHLFAELYNAVIQGERQKAKEIQTKIDPIADFHQKDIPFSYMIPTLKVMMNEFGLCGPTVLPPLTRLGAEREALIKKEMRDLDLGEVEKYIGK